MENPQYIVGSISIQKLNISCQYLHFAQTEDIQLKSALEERRGALLITGRTLRLDALKCLPKGRVIAPISDGTYQNN